MLGSPAFRSRLAIEFAVRVASKTPALVGDKSGVMLGFVPDGMNFLHVRTRILVIRSA